MKNQTIVITTSVVLLLVVFWLIMQRKEQKRELQETVRRAFIEQRFGSDSSYVDSISFADDTLKFFHQRQFVGMTTVDEK